MKIPENTGVTLQGCHPSSFPIEQNICLDDVDHTLFADEGQFHRLIGHISYLQVTQPGITLVVNTLSQYVSAPRQLHFNAALHVLRYLKATSGQRIFLPPTGDLTLKAYCDSDWLGCYLAKRSKTGYFITLGSAPVSWKTKKQ